MPPMKLADIVNRIIPPAPWAEGEKIPWDEPGFSRRMLKEHLSQEHDAASRRIEFVHAQVDYIAGLIEKGALDPDDHPRLKEILAAGLAATPQVQAVLYIDPRGWLNGKHPVGVSYLKPGQRRNMASGATGVRNFNNGKTAWIRIAKGPVSVIAVWISPK